MKNTFKRFWIFAIVAAISFLTVGCSTDNYEMLNGVWDRGDIVVTFDDSNGFFTEIKSHSIWIPFLNNGSISIGDRKFRNITRKMSDLSGELKWSCQELNTGFTWEDCTITMDSGGQKITTASVSGSPTYTKK
ncbi:MAG: hypothetical protein LBQ77_05260 [Treponema sp.]|jgi:hypothetical protein|nr:hypothetical protein [Treponema sp.]